MTSPPSKIRTAFIVIIAFLTFTSMGWSAPRDLPKPLDSTDYRSHSPAQVKLGQLLFYDRLLSGTYRVSCATCHNPDRASSNGFRIDRLEQIETDDLAINGLPLYEALKPSAKHAPALFNLGAKEFVALFGDGRVLRSQHGQFISPAKGELPEGLESIVAVQALFPVVTGDELVGTVDNELKQASHGGNATTWEALAARVRDYREYWPYFKDAYPGLQSSHEITIVEIANAIGAFVDVEWRSDKAPFDAYLRGDKGALSKQQERGLEIFFGAGKCSQCHSGALLTDHKFHVVATPLWRFDADLSNRVTDVHSDRSSFMGFDSDKYKRRTPSLRNIVHTAPYGHAGSFENLATMLNSHLNPVEGLKRFVAERSKAASPSQDVLKAVEELSERNELKPVELNESQIADLMEFLNALSEEGALRGKLGRPDDVPSSLALD